MHPIDSDFIFDLPGVAEPAVSPDGTTVAYVASQTDRDSMRGESHIESRPFGGGEPRRLTAGPNDRAPLWSPDGATLAFLRRERPRDGKPPPPPQLWLLPVDEGGEARRVTKLDGGVAEAVWSSDGRSLICVSDVDPDRPPEGDTTPRPRVVPDIYYRGDTIGWRGRTRRHLFRVDIESGASRQLTRGSAHHRSPMFSPDGQWLAFASDRSRRRGLREPWGAELCVMPAEGGRVRRLVRDVLVSGAVAWSADGSRIAFVAADEANHWQTYMHVADVTTGQHHRLTDDGIQPQAGFFPVISPPPIVWHGERVLLLAESRGSSGVYRVGIDGDVRRLRGARELIGGLSADAAARRLAFTSTTADRPGEIVAFDVRSRRPRRLTRASDAYLDEHPPGRTERFTIQRGGLTLDCWLLQPPGFDETRHYPLILEIHGGPNGYFGTGFNALHQVLAGAGYLVLSVNPRGSSTYGADFTAAVFEDWGGEDYLDLMAALDAACRRPYVDARRLGVHGYSYGGYMSAWIVGQTERFNAAAIGAPVIDLVSMYGQTDIAVTFGEPQWGGLPHDNFEEYVRRSPLTHAPNVQTPVLLLHGEADIRVPISQSEEYYVALKRRRKTVEFVRYPDCSHLFLRVGHPALRKDYYDRVVAWFDRWLR